MNQDDRTKDQLLQELLDTRRRASDLESSLAALQRHIDERVEFSEKILSSTSMAIATYRPDGQAVYVNAAIAALMGGSVDALVQQNFRKLKSWKESGLLADAEEVLATGREKRREVHFVSPFGKESWFECRLNRFSSEGEPHLLLTADDIGARKKAEEDRIQSAEKFRLLLDTMNEGFIVVDQEWRIKYANKQVSEMTGFSLDDLIGCDSELLMYDDQEIFKLRTERNKRRKGSSVRYELTFRKKDGTPLHCMISPRPTFDPNGRFTGSFSVLTDLTHIKKAERELRETRGDLERTVEHTAELTRKCQELTAAEGASLRSREMLRLVLDSIPVRVVWKDAGLVFMGANRVFAQDAGMHFPEEVIGKNDYDLPIDRETANMIRSADLRVMKSGKPEYHVLEHRHYSDGVRALLDCNRVPLVDNQGILVGILITYEDITARIQAEDALRRSEEKFRTIFEGSPLGILHFDRDGVITACNEPFIDIIGSSAGEVVGLDMLRDLMDQFVVNAVKEALSGRVGYYEGDYRSVTSNKVTPVKCYFSPLVSEDGTTLGGMGIIEDTTATKQAALAIAESERRYRELVDNATDMVYQMDSTGRFTLVNPVTLLKTGYPLEEIIGKRFADFVPPEYRDQAEKFYGVQFVKHLPATYHEIPVVTKQGDELWLGQHVQVLTDGTNITGFQGISRDVTDRKRAEEALRISEEQYKTLYQEAQKSEELYRSLLDSTPDAIVIYDEKGCTKYVTPSFTRMFGWSLEEVVGAPLDFVPDSERPMTRALVHSVINDGRPCVNFETKRLAKDGRLLEVAITGSRYLDHEHNTAGMLVIIRDITDRKRAEELLLQSERLSAISELASGVAHNFNNLLQIIMGEAGVALSNLSAGNTSRVETLLKQIVQSSRLGSGTVKRLQDLARIRTDVTDDVEATFDLAETARKAIEVSRAWWQFNYERAGTKIAFNMDLQPGCFVKGQEDEFFEVLLNLVKNSVEALERGGEVHISTRVTGESVHLSVSDNGPGITQDKLRKVFEPFWTTKGYQSTGMGLSSSLGIVRRHDGDITVLSEEGRGCTFTVELPLSHGWVDETQPPTDSAPRTKLRILVIDDEPMVLAMLQEGLAGMGQEAIGANSGDEGLKVLRERPVDLVISDLAMPGKNGWDVGQEIKAYCREIGIPKTPFVLLTGWGGQMDQVDRMSDSGVDEVLEKPVDIARLMDIAVRLVSGHSD